MPMSTTRQKDLTPSYEGIKASRLLTFETRFLNLFLLLVTPPSSYKHLKKILQFVNTANDLMSTNLEKLLKEAKPFPLFFYFSTLFLLVYGLALDLSLFLELSSPLITASFNYILPSLGLFISSVACLSSYYSYEKAKQITLALERYYGKDDPLVFAERSEMYRLLAKCVLKTLFCVAASATFVTGFLMPTLTPTLILGQTIAAIFYKISMYCYKDFIQPIPKAELERAVKKALKTASTPPPQRFDSLAHYTTPNPFATLRFSSKAPQNDTKRRRAQHTTSLSSETSSLAIRRRHSVSF